MRFSLCSGFCNLGNAFRTGLPVATIPPRCRGHLFGELLELNGPAQIEKSEGPGSQQRFFLVRQTYLVHAERLAEFNFLCLGGDGIPDAGAAEEMVFPARRHRGEPVRRHGTVSEQLTQLLDFTRKLRSVCTTSDY